MGSKLRRWPAPLFLLVFALFFALSLRQLTDSDVWFELLAGKYTATRLAVPRAEFYIYSALGYPSIFVGWLWGLCLYLAWSVGGYNAVSIFGGLVWGAIFTVGAKAIVASIERDASSNRSYSRLAVLLTTVLAISVSFQFLVDRERLRDEATLYLAWLVATALSAGIHRDERCLYRFLVVVPLLSWALGWFHTTSIFMVFFLCVQLLQAGVESRRASAAGGARTLSTRRLAAWLGSIAAAVALPILNPNGAEQVLPLIAGLERSLRAIMFGQGAVVAGHFIHINVEYRRLLDVPQVWPMAILFLVCSVLILWLDRPRRIANAVILAAGAALAFLYVRALAIWAIFLMVPLGIAAAPFIQRATTALESQGKRGWIAAFVLGCCVWDVGAVYNRARLDWGIGYHPAPGFERVLDAIRKYMPAGGNIFNDHPLGARLRWFLGPRYFVAMDGHLVDPASPAWKEYYGIADSGRTGPPLLKKWNIRAVDQPLLTAVYGQLDWLPYYLLNDPNWSMAAMDSRGVLFVRVPAGSVDEDTRRLQKMAYWRRVVIEAKYLELASDLKATVERAKKVVEYAQAQMKKLQKGRHSEISPAQR